ncbi:phosphotransferase [Maridesulfovibrio frigidus]|uniref:phosphotransferase n=1 Tax=Maridesulfovibrio frigidus TaxID=340956 RepID=UPI0004E27AE5|nr:phosphotransferase [Maridesulfovibrio frigidus]
MENKDLIRIFGEKPVEIVPIGGGGNSKVWKVTLKSGQIRTVKEYYILCSDWQDRINAEFKAFSLLREHGILCVPEPLQMDLEAGVAVYSFEDGRKVDARDIEPEKMDVFAKFAGQLFDISKGKETSSYGTAKAHCLTQGAIEEQLERRIEALKGVDAGEDDLAAELKEFLTSEFIPLYQEVASWRRSHLKLAGIDGYALKQGEWTLSPSDFGLHNGLLKDDETFVFVDFEYFGRDDPAKMVSDFMLHPAMNLSSEYVRRVYDGFDKVFGCGEYYVRIRTLLPLVGLKWCTIFLNEFLPHGLARRVHASGKDIEFQGARRRQLDKSLKQFQMIKNGYEDYLDVIVNN